MFFRLLMESFRRQRRRKILAGIAILLGTTAVTAMLALATTIGDRIHKELAVYGANIIVYPKADQLEVKVGGVDIKPASSGTYLKESDLAKLKESSGQTTSPASARSSRLVESISSRIGNSVHSGQCPSAFGSTRTSANAPAAPRKCTHGGSAGSMAQRHGGSRGCDRAKLGPTSRMHGRWQYCQIHEASMGNTHPLFSITSDRISYRIVGTGG